jgi:cold shock CspA family protein
MGGETTGKKDREKKKKKKQQEKQERRLQRKENNQKGKSLDDMMAYLDEDGNLSSTPPDPKKKKEINPLSIEISVAKQQESKAEERIRSGVIKFFDQGKGFGFINDTISKESVFVHINQVGEILKEGDKVSFEVEKGPRGLSAVRVKKLK